MVANETTGTNRPSQGSSADTAILLASPKRLLGAFVAGGTSTHHLGLWACLKLCGRVPSNHNKVGSDEQVPSEPVPCTASVGTAVGRSGSRTGRPRELRMAAGCCQQRFAVEGAIG